MRADFRISFWFATYRGPHLTRRRWEQQKDDQHTDSKC